MTTRLCPGLVLTLLGVVVASVRLGAAPAFACDCATPPVAMAVRAADVVMVGRLLDRTLDPGSGPWRVASDDVAVHRVDELRVLAGGEVGPQLEVLSAPSGASCGLEHMVVGRRYVFFLQRERTELSAHLCGGTQRATPTYLAEVEAVTGPGWYFAGPPLTHRDPPPPVLWRILRRFAWWG